MVTELLDERGMGPMERGRGRYQQKDYSGALEAFTQAITITTGHLLLTALDHRAATYEKLEKLQAALRDAKDMIDLKPELAKGYLRCGKVLQCKGEPELALKIYERGLKKVKIGTDKDRAALQSMFNKLRQRQNPGQTRDPLALLPLELAEMICDNLSMRDRVICLAVSPSWKRMLESSHKLWTTLDTSYARRSVSQNSLKKHIKRSNYTLDQAIITLRANFDAAKMNYLTKTCKKLSHLEIHGDGVIGNTLTSALPLAQSLQTIFISTGCEISLSAVKLVLKTCQQTLLEASFLKIRATYPGGYPSEPWPKLKSLRTLRLRTPETVMLDLDGLCNATPSVTSLTLNGWIMLSPNITVSGWTDLQHLDLSRNSIERLPVFPSTLRHLNLCHNTRLGTAQFQDDERNALPLLETVDFSSTSLSDGQIQRLISHSVTAGNLKRLSIGDRTSLQANDWNLYTFAESVEELSIRSLQWNEDAVYKFVNLYPNLRNLDASQTNITGVSVKDFVKVGIKWLRLDECPNISPDAVEYARGKGVTVEFNFPSRSTGRTPSFRDSTLFRSY